MKITTATILLLLAGVAQAASIVGSKHNLSSSGTGIHSPTAPQICYFCHPPHNAVQNVPLWNRPPSIWAPEAIPLYSGPTLSAAAGAAALNGQSLSMLCLSCHGGPLANIGVVLNPLGTNWAVVDPLGTWPTSGVLRDGAGAVNHPIGFDYAQAQALKPAKLRPLSGTNVGLLPLFRATAQGSTVDTTMECSSCHTVHDPANSPFLRLDNASNGLCLACHIQ